MAQSCMARIARRAQSSVPQGVCESSRPEVRCSPKGNERAFFRPPKAGGAHDLNGYLLLALANDNVAFAADVALATDALADAANDARHPRQPPIAELQPHRPAHRPRGSGLTHALCPLAPPARSARPLRPSPAPPARRPPPAETPTPKTSNAVGLIDSRARACPPRPLCAPRASRTRPAPVPPAQSPPAQTCMHARRAALPSTAGRRGSLPLADRARAAFVRTTTSPLPPPLRAPPCAPPLWRVHRSWQFVVAAVHRVHRRLCAPLHAMDEAGCLFRGLQVWRQGCGSQGEGLGGSSFEARGGWQGHGSRLGDGGREQGCRR